MGNDMLSQDELNALLNNEKEEVEYKDSPKIQNYLSDFEIDAIGEIGNISFGTASTALSALLGQKVEITTPKIDSIYAKDLSNEFPDPHVAVHVKYTDGFDGTNLLVLKSKDAKVIADLMLGGNGEELTSSDLSEMEISAVQEAMNQMMGSTATSISTIFNRSVSISPPGVNILDITRGKGNEYIPNEEIILIVSFDIKVGSLVDSNIMQIITVPFAKMMVDYLIIKSDETEQSQNEYNNSNMPVSEHIEEVVVSNQMKDVSNKQVYNTTESLSDNIQNNIPNNIPSSIPSTRPIDNNINIQSAQFSELEMKRNAKNNDTNLCLLMDIPLQISVELGRTKKLIKDILEFSSGSIIELDKLAGEPVDIYANNKLIAKGEVVVIDENFGVRITDIISQIDRVKRLQ